MTSERDWRGLLFVAPFLLLYAVILIFPLLRGIWLSFNQVDLFGEGHFVGLGNYALLARDGIFVTSINVGIWTSPARPSRAHGKVSVAPAIMR